VEKLSSRVLMAFLWLVVGLASYLILVLTTELIPSAKKERDYQREYIEVLEKQLEENQRKIEIKRRFLNKLNTDPEFLQRVARERLDVVRPDETIIRFEEQPEG
jgi:cell division protein FtsB